jgi:hypothetical protein
MEEQRPSEHPTTLPETNLNVPTVQPRFAAIRRIRMINLALVVGIFIVLPLLPIILWVVLMKQYRIPVIGKIFIVLFSGIIGPLLVIAAMLGNLDTTGEPVFSILIPSLLVVLAPYIYTFINPSGHKPI